mgnify:FL=1
MDNRNLEDAQKVAGRYLKRRLPSEATEKELKQLLDIAGKSTVILSKPAVTFCPTLTTTCTEINTHKRKDISPAETGPGEHSGKSVTSKPCSNTVHNFVEIESVELMDTRVTLETPVAKKPKPAVNIPASSVHLYDGSKDQWIIAPLDERKLVVLGDSNLRHAKPTPGVDYFVLPGAHIRHATLSIKNWLPAKPTDKYSVAIQIGINNRGLVPEVIDLELKELKRAVDAQPSIVKLAFVGVSIPPGLTDREQHNLRHLNTRTLGMVGEENYVHGYDGEELEVGNDNIHYRQKTVDLITGQIAAKLAKTNLY